MLARARRRRGRRAADDPGAARRPARPARARAERARARARLGRGRGLPPRRRPGARARRARGDDAADRARSQGARPPRPAAVPGRRRVPVPPPADPRRRLRRAPEGDAGGAARALRRLARRARRAIWSSPTRSSATTSSRRYRYRAELGRAGGGDDGARPASRGAAGGRQRPARCSATTSAAAVNLLERAVALLPPEGRGIELDLDLADALFRSSRFADADAVRQRRPGGRPPPATIEASCWRGSSSAATCLTRPGLPTSASFSSLPGGTADVRGRRGRRRAHRRLARDRLRRAQLLRHEAKLAAASTDWSTRRRAGLHRYEPELRWSPGERVLLGADAGGGVPPLARLEPRARDPRADPPPLPGGTVAMLGRFDEARDLLAAFRARGEELGHGFWAAASTQHACRIETLAGDLEAAEREIRHGCELWEAAGEQAYLSTFAGELAKTLAALGRLDEAEEWAGRSAELGVSDDVATQMLWREAQAKVHALRGEPPKLTSGPEAISLIEGRMTRSSRPTPGSPSGRSLRWQGRPTEAEAALEEALGRYEQKRQPRDGRPHATTAGRALRRWRHDERYNRPWGPAASGPSMVFSIRDAMHRRSSRCLCASSSRTRRATRGRSTSGSSRATRRRTSRPSACAGA